MDPALECPSQFPEEVLRQFNLAAYGGCKTTWPLTITSKRRDRRSAVPLIIGNLDRCLDCAGDEHGVSVIDAKNSGNPATFAVLARALDIPWLAVFDGDDAGQGYITDLHNRGFPADELQRRCQVHSAGDLEAQLVADGFESEVRDTLATLGMREAADLNKETLLTRLRSRYKTACAAAFAARFRDDPTLAQRAPEAFRNAIEQLRGLT